MAKLMRSRRGAVLALLLLLALALGVAGCGGGDPDADTQADTNGGDAAPSSGSARPVLMMGRSVMEGWFAHLDPAWDWESPVVRDGFALTYGPLETPPEIARSACGLIEDAEPGTTVFFKFCFDDFWGGSGRDGREELEDLTGWVREVAECAAERDVVLIVGNALPKVATYTDDALVTQHREYNQWLGEFAAEAPGEVHVFDLYGLLSTTVGALRPEFAISPNDSHLNDAAYGELEQPLFELLERVAGE